MDTLETTSRDYLSFYQYQKGLDSKTLKAYWLDLKQFKEFTGAQISAQASVQKVGEFISMLCQKDCIEKSDKILEKQRKRVGII